MPDVASCCAISDMPLCIVFIYSRTGATNLENLEYLGISLNLENSGNSRGILCNRREKIVTNIKYLCKRAVDWVNRIIRISESGDPSQ